MDDPGAPIHVTSAEFQRNAGRYQMEAQHGPVVITQADRPHSVLVSANLFEVLTKGRVARLVEDLDDETVDAIASSSVHPRHAELDRLIDDWTP